MEFFRDESTLQPKGDVKIESVKTQVYPDRRRVWVEIQVTPFKERPNLLLLAYDGDGKVVGELNIISTMHAWMEFTMHLRSEDDTEGQYELAVELFYETRNPPQDKRVVTFEVPEADDESSEA